MRMMLRRALPALLACAIASGCGEKDPPAPDPDNPSGDIQISGNERIGWSQQAADVVELALFEYVVYVDGTRTALAGVNCSSSATASGFDCSAALPPLTPGPHMLELASVFADLSGLFESGRSAPLRVVMTGGGGTTSSSASISVTTLEGVKLFLDRIVDGLHVPTDLAFSADGAIFIAERGGTVRAFRQNALAPDPALDLSDEVVLPQGGMLAIALDPNFDETGFMYALYAVGVPRDGLEFTLARFRGVQDRFAERAVLLDRIPASAAGASGALRIGPDGKLYVALDSAEDLRIAGSFASYNGKVLRLNVDATTPDDQPGLTPIFSLDHPLPRALDWQPLSGNVWVIDGLEPSGGRLSAVVAGESQRRAALRTAYALPQGTGASSAAFYRGDLMPMFRGNLFVAAATGRQLIRLQFDRDNATRITSVARLLTDQIGAVRVVAEGRDGALYLAGDTALYRLHP